MSVFLIWLLLLVVVILVVIVCISVGMQKILLLVVVEMVLVEVVQVEVVCVVVLYVQLDWVFQGWVVVSKGKDGGSGCIDWKQEGCCYVVELSVLVIWQSWKLIGDIYFEVGCLEGLVGGLCDGEDVQQLLLEVIGWDILVNQLLEWIRGLVVGDVVGFEMVECDVDGWLCCMQQMGWQVQYLDWYLVEVGCLVLLCWIEVSNGDVKVCLLVDQWGQGVL